MSRLLPCVLLLTLTACLPDLRPPEQPQRSPCSDITCAEGRCLIVASESCECVDRQDGDSTCGLSSPCNPTPCTSPFRSQCLLEDGAPVCVCDPGHAAEGDGCSAAPVFDCPGAPPRVAGEPQEPDDCPKRAWPVSSDAKTVHSDFESGGDFDWYRFDCAAPRIYDIKLFVTDNGVLVDVFGADGVTSIAEKYFERAVEASLSVRCDRSGPLYLRLSASRRDVTTLYSVSVKDTGLADDHPDRAELARTFQPSGRISGGLQFDGDVDVLRLDAPAGMKLEVSAGPVTARDIALAVLDVSGNVVERLEHSKLSMPLVARTDEGLFVAISGATADERGSWELILTPLGQDDHADRPAQGTALLPGEPGASGDVEDETDLDLFSFRVSRDHIYRLACLGEGWRCELSVRDAGGKDVLRFASEYTWRAPADEELFATVRRYGPATQSKYRLLLEVLGADDHVDDANALATPIAPGGGGTARSDFAGDIDTFRFEAQAGHVYRFTCSAPGWNCKATALLGSGWQHSAASPIAFETMAAGTVWLQATNVPAATEYQWSLEDLGLDDHADDADAATVIALGVGSASFEADDDVDWFAFDGVAGSTYELYCLVVTTPCLSDVHAGDGAMLATSDHATGLLHFVAPSTGRYLLRIRSRVWRASPYRWWLGATGVDDYPQQVGAGHPLVLGTPQSGQLESADDVDSFAFDAESSHYYRLTVQSAPSEVGVDIREAPDRPAVVSRLGSAWLVRASTTGKMLVHVSTWTKNARAGYSLTIEDLGSDDHANSKSAATALPSGSRTLAGRFEVEIDRDFFAIELLPGTYSLEFSGAPLGFMVEDPQGRWLTSGTSSDMPTFPVASEGQYVVRIEPDAMRTLGIYTLTFR